MIRDRISPIVQKILPKGRITPITHDWKFQTPHPYRQPKKKKNDITLPTASHATTRNIVRSKMNSVNILTTQTTLPYTDPYQFYTTYAHLHSSFSLVRQVLREVLQWKYCAPITVISATFQANCLDLWPPVPTTGFTGFWKITPISTSPNYGLYHEHPQNLQITNKTYIIDDQLLKSQLLLNSSNSFLTSF